MSGNRPGGQAVDGSTSRQRNAISFEPFRLIPILRIQVLQKRHAVLGDIEIATVPGAEADVINAHEPRNTALGGRGAGNGSCGASRVGLVASTCTGAG